MPYINDVFTPATPAKLTFVERTSIDDRLVRALQTKGKQLVIYGHSGAGKTTLLTNKLFKIFENHITTRCMVGMSFEQILLQAFDSLNPFYLKETTSETSSDRKAKLGAEYRLLKLDLEASRAVKNAQRSERYLPPQLTPQLLAALLGAIRAPWILEDFHKVDEAVKVRLAQTMKIFMDSANDYDDVKIIAVGAVGTGREVVQFDSEMSGRVAEISVPLMDERELEEIIFKGGQLLNLSFEPEVSRKIAETSAGLPAICHQLCLNVCHVLNLNETSHKKIVVTDAHLDGATKMYVDDSSDSLKQRFDKAVRTQRKVKFENGQIILTALCKAGTDGATYNQLAKEIEQRHPDYPSGNLTLYLRELQLEQRGNVISFDSASGLYFFSDPFIRALCTAKLSKSAPSKKDNFWELIGSVLVERLVNDLGKDQLPVSDSAYAQSWWYEKRLKDGEK